MTITRFVLNGGVAVALLTAQPLFSQTSQPAPVSAAPPPAVATTPARSIDEVADRLIRNEHALRRRLLTVHPVLETYIQELKPDPELGAVPKSDVYFLGKLAIDRGAGQQSLIPAPWLGKRVMERVTSVFSGRFLPNGFAEMVVLSYHFNKASYNFEFVKREFLGDVRCLVLNVVPKHHDHGLFIGRIWVEDAGYNIVRVDGTFISPPTSESYVHFDSWRINAGPNLWLPADIYTEEGDMPHGMFRAVRFKGQTRLWGYEAGKNNSNEQFTDLVVDAPQQVSDQSPSASDAAPVEAERLWERQAEDNVLDRLQKAGLLAPTGDVDKVVQTVLTNLQITNKINLQPAVRARILLTTPLECFTVGHTVVISRGLLDVLPDEASLAAVLAHELANIDLGYSVNTKYAFADRLFFPDTAVLKNLKLTETEAEETAANQKSLEILKNSPYDQKLPQFGLFLRALNARSKDMPHLIRPLFGNRMAEPGKILELATLMENSPQLKPRSMEQVPALPLGGRIKLDPWTDQLELKREGNPTLQFAREKLSFEVTPFFLHLSREPEVEQAANNRVQGE
jgi:hypothetical protein